MGSSAAWKSPRHVHATEDHLPDEPAAGLNPQETEALSQMIRVLRDEHDITVVLIEHDMGMVMSISDHIVVWTTAT